jgi:hypothetical protein
MCTGVFTKQKIAPALVIDDMLPFDLTYFKLFCSIKIAVRPNRISICN